MEKDEKKREDLSVENVEKTIDEAIQKYFDLNMIVDALFWKSAISLLKKKYTTKKGD